MGAVNAEVNAGICTVQRMLQEASDINDWLMCVSLFANDVNPLREGRSPLRAETKMAKRDVRVHKGCLDSRYCCIVVCCRHHRSNIPSTTPGEKGSRLKFRTASFCTERSGHFDGFDQGVSFFLPNMTWLQPPGYVHQMIKDSWQPNVPVVSMDPPQVRSDGKAMR